jgi:L-Lysine epsilon oxidase N-terminal/L-lysine epsilon oxidase C-terminal domain
MIVRAAIYPAMGIARVGNSPTEYFIAPEVTDPIPEPPGFYRDATGALKRQAARFRIYGFDAEGAVVGELTAESASIRWTVHVANKKAAWYQWQIALDIPEAATVQVPLRNASVKGSDRQGLVIDGGPRSIEGSDIQGPEYEFVGQFQGTEVSLGEIRTDEAGRLLFLGGHGVSASPTGSPIFNPADPNGFINADGWYDDTSDGPVTAEVSVDGRSIPVAPAWVVTAPPNYGPGIKGIRTLYDLLLDLAISGGWFPFPAQVSFRDDILPILRRLSGLQWSNQGFAAQFGRGRPYDFDDPDLVAKLGKKPATGSSDPYAELRLQILHTFRDPEGTDNNQLPWPWIYGDAMALPPAATPRQNASISPTQYAILTAWATGQFVDDADVPGHPPRQFSDVPLDEQPTMLDRGALEFCLADAFHPGCEVTWPIRHLTMYSAPFRVRHRPTGVSEPDYGSVLTQKEVLSMGGPLYAQGPGDLTRWMGLPWQADTGFCRSGYSVPGYTYDPYVPTFWPARVPNQVLTEPNYDVAIDPSQPRDRRLAAFSERMDWNAPLKASTTAGQMDKMVEIFGDMGLLEVRPGVEGDPELPPIMLVASFGGNITPTAPVAPAAPAAVPGPAPSQARSILNRQNRREETEEPEEQWPLPVRYPDRR